MQSPFPGMDPYLEGNLWTSVHGDLATTIARQLVPRLRPKYIALTERKYISGAWEEVMISAGAVRPDVAVRRSKGRHTEPIGGIAVAGSVKLRTYRGTKVPHFRIAVRDVHERQLVTAIELLSPTYKEVAGATTSANVAAFCTALPIFWKSTCITRANEFRSMIHIHLRHSSTGRGSDR